MKGWIGALIGVVTIVIALLVDPARFFGSDAAATKISFLAVLFSAAGLAFYLGRETSELNLSRHVAVWSAGLAAAAIVAVNLEFLTGSSNLQKAAIKTVGEKKPAKEVSSGEIVVPDTLKINRVETEAKPSQLSLNPFAKSKWRPVGIKKSETEKGLPEGREVTEQQKQQFKEFLESQGLKYDPKTAFSFSDEESASQDAPPPSSEKTTKKNPTKNKPAAETSE